MLNHLWYVLDNDVRQYTAGVCIASIMRNVIIPVKEGSMAGIPLIMLEKNRSTERNIGVQD